MNSCVCCGKIIPEGRQICPNCDADEKKLTDKETIKALECCSYDVVACNDDCPLAGAKGCTQKMASAALEYIAWLSSLVERLKTHNQALSTEIVRQIEEKSELREQVKQLEKNLTENRHDPTRPRTI